MVVLISIKVLNRYFRIKKIWDKRAGWKGNREVHNAERKWKEKQCKFTKAIKDIRIFINTIKQAIILMKKSGVDAKAAQFDRGNYVEFVIRIPK